MSIVEKMQKDAELQALRTENASLSAWQCVYTDGKTGLVGDEHGNQYCAMARQVEALRAEVERLKSFEELYKAGCTAWNPTFKTILDERDALRAEVERPREALIDVTASLAATVSLLERGGKKAAPSNTMFEVMLDDYRKSLERARAAIGQLAAWLEKKGAKL